MSTESGPELTHLSAPTKVPTVLRVHMTLPPGGTATRGVNIQREIVLQDLAVKASGPALIRIPLTETSDPDVPTIHLPAQSFQDYLEQELPMHLSALVGEERTEWERKNGVLLAAADAGDDEAFFELLGRDPRHLTSERTLRRVLTWRTEVWAAAGFVDTSLRSFRLPFELHRTEIAQRRVPSRGIVEALDVIEHVGFGLVSRAILLVRRPFGLERGEEALHRGIVPDVAGPAHASRSRHGRPGAAGRAHWCTGCPDRSDATRPRASPDARWPSRAHR